MTDRHIFGNIPSPLLTTFMAHVATLDVEDVKLSAVLKLNLKKYTYTFV